MWFVLQTRNKGKRHEERCRRESDNEPAGKTCNGLVEETSELLQHCQHNDSGCRGYDQNSRIVNQCRFSSSPFVYLFLWFINSNILKVGYVVLIRAYSRDNTFRFTLIPFKNIFWCMRVSSQKNFTDHLNRKCFSRNIKWGEKERGGRNA